MPPRKKAAAPTNADGAFRWNEEQNNKLLMLFVHAKNPDLSVSGWGDLEPAIKLLFDGKVTQVSAKHQWQKLKKTYLGNGGGDKVKHLLKGSALVVDRSEAPTVKSKGGKSRSTKKARGDVKLSDEKVGTIDVDGDGGEEDRADDGESARSARSDEDDDDDDDVETTSDEEDDDDDHEDAEDGAHFERGESDGEDAQAVDGKPNTSGKGKITSRTTARAKKQPAKKTTTRTKKRGAAPTSAAGRQTKKPRTSAAGSSAASKEAPTEGKPKLDPGKNLNDFLAF